MAAVYTRMQTPSNQSWECFEYFTCNHFSNHLRSSLHWDLDIPWTSQPCARWTSGSPSQSHQYWTSCRTSRRLRASMTSSGLHCIQRAAWVCQTSSLCQVSPSCPNYSTASQCCTCQCLAVLPLPNLCHLPLPFVPVFLPGGLSSVHPPLSLPSLPTGYSREQDISLGSRLASPQLTSHFQCQAGRWSPMRFYAPLISLQAVWTSALEQRTLELLFPLGLLSLAHLFRAVLLSWLQRDSTLPHCPCLGP